MDDEKIQTYTMEVNGIIEYCGPFIVNNYPKVRESLRNGYKWPEIDFLRCEICLCLTFGLCQAAITLTLHMIESLLKEALIVKETELINKNHNTQREHTIEAFISMYQPAREKYGQNDLGKNINCACSMGLITKEQKKVLHKIRERVRNAYFHSDKKRTFGNQEIKGQSIHFEGDQLIFENPEIVKLAEFSGAHGIAQKKQAELNAIPLFHYVDNLAREIREKIFGSISGEDSNQTNSES